MDAQIVDNQKDFCFASLMRRFMKSMKIATLQRTLVELNRMRPRLLTAAIMLVENFCPVCVRIGVCLLARNLADLILVANTRLVAPVNHRLVALCPRRELTDNPAPARPRSFADRAVSPASKVSARKNPTASNKAASSTGRGSCRISCGSAPAPPAPSTARKAIASGQGICFAIQPCTRLASTSVSIS